MIITLRNIKGIKELKFTIPAPGVWVLTGLNGSGKTSLFASIYRIGASHAFQRFYKTSKLEHKLDSYDTAEIEYELNGQSVKYHHGGQRWRATPRRNSGLLDQAPYSSVEYIAASGDRIEPFPEEIQPRRVRQANQDICEFLTYVLGNEKWNNLKYVNTRRGISNDAYLIPYTVGNKTYYFSEKSFSLGELCVLKLAKKLCTISNGGLLLIDEVEMALHPLAQVKLLKKVRIISRDKNLTVLFSTHSATIIKNSSQKKLIQLKPSEEGKVLTVVGAFPAQVLGDIAFDDELSADFVFYVEDKQAKLLTEQMIGMYMNHCHPDADYRPVYKVAPVGGFVQVLEMLNNSSSIFPAHVKRYALLDEDVKTVSLVEARRTNNQSVLDLFNTAGNGVKFLPCTPEVGVIELFEVNAINNAGLLNQLNSMFSGSRINIRNLISADDYVLLTANNPRDRAKARLKNIVSKVCDVTGLDEIHVRRTIFNEYCKFKFSNDLPALKRLLSPIFNSR